MLLGLLVRTSGRLQLYLLRAIILNQSLLYLISASLNWMKSVQINLEIAYEVTLPKLCSLSDSENSSSTHQPQTGHHPWFPFHIYCLNIFGHLQFYFMFPACIALIVILVIWAAFPFNKSCRLEGRTQPSSTHFIILRKMHSEYKFL